MRFFAFLAIIGTLLLNGIPAVAQEQPNLENGLKAYGSYDMSAVDAVSLSNGNLVVKIPLFSYPQRGSKLSVDYFLISNGKSWQAQQFGGPNNTTIHKWRQHSPGLHLVSSLDVEVQRTRTITQDSSGTIQEQDGDYNVLTPDGSRHWLIQSDATNYLTIDGSGYHFILTRGTAHQGDVTADTDDTGILIDRQGTRYSYSSITSSQGVITSPPLSGTTITTYNDAGQMASILDVDGNTITRQGLLQSDTLGRTNYPSVGTTDSTGCVSTRTIVSVNQYLFPGLGGVNSPIKLCFANYTLAPTFSEPNVQAFPPATESEIVTAVLPNGSTWAFDYDAFGNLTSLTLPSGGTISYQWTEVAAPYCDDGSFTKVSRAVLSRSVNDNSTSQTWNYTWSQPQPDGTMTNYVTDANLNDTAHVFTAIPGVACAFFENETRFYQGSRAANKVLKTVDFHHTGNAAFTDSGLFFAANVVQDIVKTTLSNGSVSQITRGFDTGLVNTGIATFGNVTSETVTDYGSNGPGPVLKQTTTTYKWKTDTTGNYLAANLLDFPDSVVITDGSGCAMAETDYAYDETTYPVRSYVSTVGSLPPGTFQAAPNPVRGHATTLSRKWFDHSACTPSSPSTVSSHTIWYDTGEVYQTIDPLGHTTTLSYASGFAGGYVTQTCSPQTGTFTHCVSGTYDLNTGHLLSFTDQNSQVSNYSYDNMWRLYLAQAPPDPGNGGLRAQTQLIFSPPNSFPANVQRQRSITSALTDVSTTYFDGIGRPTKNTHVTPSGTVNVVTTFDGLSHPVSVTNPFFTTADATYGTVSSQFDGLGRATQVTEQDGSIRTIDYTGGNCSTSSDEAGKQRRTCADALGRLVEVDEPNPVTQSLNINPYVTLYKYDALGDLLCVEQHGSVSSSGCSSAPANDATSQWRIRRFTYDSLSRLLRATNPESGTIYYSYDADGNLVQKNSPPANNTGTTQVVTYCYDGLHRITSKTYGTLNPCSPFGPVGPADFYYGYDSGTNGIGHLTGLTDKAGTGSYFYDILGRLTGETRTLIGANNATVSKNISYTYNLDGSVKTLTYPSGKVITYAPDSAGHTLSAVDSGSGINYVTGATYGPDSALTGFISGSGGAAAITNAFSYNKRLQPVAMSASTASQTLFSIGYDFHLGSGDNGNVFGITNNKDHTRDQMFTYDVLNRLTSARNAGTDCTVNILNGQKKFWGNTYAYDPWGNLLSKTVTNCSSEALSVTADVQNRIHAAAPDYTYDAAGNMLHDATNGLNYTWDQENRLTGANGFTYTYDGDGNRVRKSNGNTAVDGTLYWYMTPGVVAESDLAGTLKSEYIFFDGERVARRDGATGTGGVFYYFSDHLKTASVITDSAGAIKAESDYYPWGGELQFVNNDSNRYKFTGKERDVATGLDYFGKRYYSNGLGRWTSVDPILIKIDRLIDPQRLNLYAMVGNNPVTNKDPDGADLVSGSGDQKAIKSALKEIASHPGGRAFLTKMDKLTQTIRLSTGTGLKRTDGSHTPGKNGPEPGTTDTHYTRTRDSSNNIVDVTKPNAEVTIDPAFSQVMRDTHDPDAPKSDAELLFHELKEVEQGDFQLPHSETATNAEIDSILDTKADKDLRKSADQFVDDLLKPNPQPTPTPTPPPPPPPTPEKKEPQ